MSDMFFGKWQTGIPPKDVPCIINYQSGGKSFLRLDRWMGDYWWGGWRTDNVVSWCVIKRPKLQEGVKHEY